jgi:hypothetical protein
MRSIQNTSKIAADNLPPGRCRLASCVEWVEFSGRVRRAVTLVATFSVGHVLSL